MRRDLVFVGAIVAVALFVRVYPAWNTVFGGGSINFLETDAWYHVRLVENQVRNYPWRVTMDPYAAPGGQFVAIAPLFDTLTATVVVLLHGRDATTVEVERTAAFIPPMLGAFTVIAVWALGRSVFGRAAGLLAASLLSILPGHFMDRTMLGFVDHHALEACLAVVTLLTFVRALAVPSRVREVTAGVALGLYLLGWSSGAFLVAVIGLWFVLVIMLGRRESDAPGSRAAYPDLQAAARSCLVAALVAFVLVVVFQDPRMHRYGSQIVALLLLAGLALPLAAISSDRVAHSRRSITLSIVTTLAVTAATTWFLAPTLPSQILVDLGRLAPDSSRMHVLEARPLFYYPGGWTPMQPWEFFRTGFYVGLMALVLFIWRIMRARRPADLLIWLYAVATFVATIGQNRFGYYLVTACALLGGWLGAEILEWGEEVHKGTSFSRVRVPFARELAAIIVTGAMFAPNVSRSLLLAPRSPVLSDYWQGAMTWLRRETPPPFLNSVGMGDDYYFARYPREQAPRPGYAIMNWWDQGYWLIQRALRVPVSNPTQARAPIAARFYVETDEARAVSIARQDAARFILSDWELPFRLTPDGVVMGRFQSVVDWASAPHAKYYEIYYRRENDAWIPLWVFHAPYYESMTYRLAVIGGRAGIPDKSTTVVTVLDRADSSGITFREVLSQHTYPTYEAALEAAAASTHPQTLVVGLDPWQPAFPLRALTSFVERYGVRTPEQKPTEAPWVRVFEVTPR